MSAAFSPVAAILRKREGGAHPPGEIRDLIQGFLRDEVTDYQMTAWMMAIYFRGLTAAENAELTMAMLASGRPLPPWTEGPPVVDKHSTGGVGDKVSLIVAPLAAACGLRVPMISGRALGHTGGTLDKLQSIPGYAIFLESDRFRRIVDRVGCSIVGASRDLVPADRRMYALRDVSGIVESVPLIVSSILSKKAAARLTGLVADVKVGPGAFLPDRASARDLGSRLVEAGDALGIRTTAILTRMDRPLGRTIGNALEVAEAAEWLRGEDREEDLTAVTTALAEEMLRAGGIDAAEARRRMAAALTSGAALEKLAAMIEAHGGDPRVLEDPRRLPHAPVIREVRSSGEGWCERIEPRAIAEAVMDLGGGRRTIETEIDPRVGVRLLVKVGDRVAVGQTLAETHAADGSAAEEIAPRIASAFHLSAGPPPPGTAVLERIEGPV